MEGVCLLEFQELGKVEQHQGAWLSEMGEFCKQFLMWMSGRMYNCRPCVVCVGLTPPLASPSSFFSFLGDAYY